MLFSRNSAVTGKLEFGEVMPANYSRFLRNLPMTYSWLALALASAAWGAPLPTDSCLFALSSNASRSFQVAGGSFTTACSIAVASTNNEAFQMEGQLTLNLNNRAQVAVVGGFSLNGNTLRDTVLNQNVTPISITTPADPLASLVVPTTGTIVRASATNYDNNNPPPGNTMNPGVYCGDCGWGIPKASLLR